MVHALPRLGDRPPSRDCSSGVQATRPRTGVHRINFSFGKSPLCQKAGEGLLPLVNMQLTPLSEAAGKQTRWCRTWRPVVPEGGEPVRGCDHDPHLQTQGSFQAEIQGEELRKSPGVWEDQGVQLTGQSCRAQRAGQAESPAG